MYALFWLVPDPSFMYWFSQKFLDVSDDIAYIPYVLFLRINVFPHGESALTYPANLGDGLVWHATMLLAQPTVTVQEMPTTDHMEQT